MVSVTVCQDPLSDERTRVETTPIIRSFISPVRFSRLGARVNVSLLVLQGVVVVMLCAGQDAGDIRRHCKKVRDTHCNDEIENK